MSSFARFVAPYKAIGLLERSLSANGILLLDHIKNKNHANSTV